VTCHEQLLTTKKLNQLLKTELKDHSLSAVCHGHVEEEKRTRICDVTKE
jgi:hypothetical protein